MAEDDMEEMRKRAEEWHEHAKDGAKKTMNMAQSKFMETKEQVKDAIKRDPVNAAMVAAGLGFLAGLALSCAVMSKMHMHRCKEAS